MIEGYLIHRGRSEFLVFVVEVVTIDVVRVQESASQAVMTLSNHVVSSLGHSQTL